MKKVKVLQSFFVAKSSARYVKGWTGEISDELAKRHGSEGTGFVQLAADAKPSPNLKKAK